MRLPEVLFFYALLGGVVTAYAYRQNGAFSVIASLLWPLWLPLHLAPRDARYDTAPHCISGRQGLARLEELLRDWDPSLVPCLLPLGEGLRELSMRRDALATELARPENHPGMLRADGERAGAVGEVARRRESNVQEMGRLHQQLDLEIQTALAQVEELCSRVQLARFSGVASDSVGTQLTQLVAVIDGAREIEDLGASLTGKLGL